VELIHEQFSSVVIYQASDGQEAQLKFESAPVSVIILEAHLSRRTSTQIIQNLNSSKKAFDQQVIVLSKNGTIAALEDYVSRGTVQVVTGGLIRDQIIASIYIALERLNQRHPEDFQTRYIQKGQVLLREGDRADRIFILKKGRLGAFINPTGTAPERVGFIGPGEFVGEMAYINGEPRSASVIAEEDSELVEIQISAFDQIIYRKPSWMKALLGTLSRRVKSLNRARSKTQSA